MERERLLIDTSILIDHLRKTQKDKTVFYLLSSQYDCLISAITEFEFSIGSTPPIASLPKSCWQGFQSCLSIPLVSNQLHKYIVI